MSKIDLSPLALARFWWTHTHGWAKWVMLVCFSWNVLASLAALIVGDWEEVGWNMGYNIALACFILATTVPDKIRTEDQIQEMNGSLMVAEIALSLLCVLVILAMVLRHNGVL